MSTSYVSTSVNNIIYNKWFSLPSKIWFSSGAVNDNHINSLFNINFDEVFTLEFYSSLFNKLDVIRNMEPETIIEHIIICDQLSRHYFRNKMNGDKYIFNYTETAVKLALYYYTKFFPKHKWELVFVTLPLRHNPTGSRIVWVYERINEYLLKNPQDKEFITRLLKTTRVRYDLYKRSHRNDLEYDIDTKNVFDSCILDVNQTCSYRQETDGKKQWLELSNMLPGNITCTDVWRRLLPYLKTIENRKVLLSLSGGVDSMVLAMVLWQARRDYNINVSCIHINYQKRKESDAEAKFLMGFCRELRFHLRIVKIDPTRPDTIQNWETGSKKQRFEAYKTELEHLGSSVSNDKGIVWQGHHGEDVHENFMMNMFASGDSSGGRCIAFDMSGMSPFQLLHNVYLVRPYLTTQNYKHEIYKAANITNTPYFKDTSFIHASRIRIRRELFPLCEEIFGEHFKDRCENMISQTKMLDDYFTKKWVKPIQESVRHLQSNPRYGFTINMGKLLREKEMHRDLKMQIILKVITPLLYSNGLNIPTQKSIKSVIDYYENIYRKCEVSTYTMPTTTRKVQFRNGYDVKSETNGRWTFTFTNS